MKKEIAWSILFTILLTACNQTREEKADALITDIVKESLFHPESYSPVRTRVDSAFTPFDDPDFFKKALKLSKINEKITQLKEEEYIENILVTYYDLLRISSDHISYTSRENFKQMQEDYDNFMKQKAKTEEKAKKLMEELQKEMDKKCIFIGFKVRHRFRTDNNAGETIFAESEFLLDKDMKQIITEHDTESCDYKAVQAIYKLLRGEDTEFE